LLEPRAKVLIYGQSTLTGPTAIQTEEIEENFEQKVAKEAKTEQELGLRHHHSVESFPERDVPRLRMLLESQPRSELWPPRFSTHIFASFATFCSNSLSPLL
jgi:hypothetical protein